MSSRNNSQRLVEVDALRGLAALSVVLFHYTTRFGELFGWKTAPTISVPDGHYGVNLFFIISGFVIFMTLEKTARPMDFVVSRFSRLFPAYWMAIAVTFGITHWLGLPDKLVDSWTAVRNVFMIHGLFRIPHVDSVYWTLEVELLFYCGMFILFTSRYLDRIHLALWVLLGLRLTYHLLARLWGIELSWTLSHLLNLTYIPWFALGISIYLTVSRADAASRRQPAITAIAAIGCLLIVDSLFLAILSLCLATAVFLAASGRASVLRHPVLVWLGAISYPLYLLHENIGWSILLRFQSWGIATDAAIVCTIATSLAMATALTRLVEQPAMRWIRSRYHHHRAAQS